MAHPRPDDAEHDEFDGDGTGQQHEGGQGVGGIAEDSLCCVKLTTKKFKIISF